MDLLASVRIPPVNILSQDGIAEYYGPVLPSLASEDYFERLLNNIDWKHDEVDIYGKHIVTKRKVAWYAEQPFEYTYSNTTKIALPFTDELKALKERIEDKCAESFNACLLNLYHNGSEGMAWHSDDELELKKDAAIASLSLGAVRKFLFKHKHSKETTSLMLENGSLLVMKGKTQAYWQHCLPTTKKVDSSRINLTFRTMSDYK